MREDPQPPKVTVVHVVLRGDHSLSFYQPGGGRGGKTRVSKVISNGSRGWPNGFKKWKQFVLSRFEETNSSVTSPTFPKSKSSSSPSRWEGCWSRRPDAVASTVVPFLESCRDLLIARCHVSTVIDLAGVFIGCSFLWFFSGGDWTDVRGRRAIFHLFWRNTLKSIR